MTSPEKIEYLRSLASHLPGDSAATQCQRLHTALGRYSLTTFEAMRFLDIYHVPARILQLRKSGVQILTTREQIVTEQGNRHRVGRYSLKVGC